MDVIWYAGFSRGAASAIAADATYTLPAALAIVTLLGVSLWLYRRNYARFGWSTRPRRDSFALVLIGAAVFGPLWIFGAFFLASMAGTVSPAAVFRVYALSTPVLTLILLAGPYARSPVLMVAGIVHQTALFGLGISAAVSCSLAVGVLVSIGSILIAHVGTPLIFGLLLLTGTPLPVYPGMERMPMMGYVLKHQARIAGGSRRRTSGSS